jgi:hypothetical protein
VVLLVKILRAHELPVEHVNPRYPVIRSTIAPRTPGVDENDEPYGASGRIARRDSWPPASW